MNHPTVKNQDQVLCLTAYGTWLWNPDSRMIKYTSKSTYRVYNLKQLSKKDNSYSNALRVAAKFIAKHPEYRQLAGIESVNQLKEMLA